jgi:hypothetical protein
MTDMSRYSYSPTEATEIRLLKFLKADQDGISGTFQKFPIVQYSHSLPQYTALSYVWFLHGTSDAKSGHISIDEGQLHVFDFLQPFFEVL